MSGVLQAALTSKAAELAARAREHKAELAQVHGTLRTAEAALIVKAAKFQRGEREQQQRHVEELAQQAKEHEEGASRADAVLAVVRPMCGLAARGSVHPVFRRSRSAVDTRRRDS